MKKFLSTIAFTAVAVLFGLTDKAKAEPAANDAVRAAMVLNFARFADWGPGRFDNASAPVVVCVEAGTKLGEQLSALQGKDVGQRTLLVRRIPSGSFDATCQMAVFSNRAPSADRIKELNGNGLLTIGDSKDFAKTGVIEFVQVGRQLRFRINNTVALQSGIKLRSQLLRLALTVE